MALVDISFIDCGNNFFGGFTVDDTLIPVSVGDVISLSGCGKNEVKNIEVQVDQNCPVICVTIQGIKEPGFPSPNAVILNNYGPEQCDTCIQNEYQYVELRRCFSDETWIFNISDFPSPLSVGQVFSLSFYIGYFGQITQVSGCFEVDRFSLFSEFTPVITSIEPKIDCQDCVDTAPVLYQVEDCITEVTFVMAYPSTGLENHLITYTDLDGLTQYCGRVLGVIEASSTQIIFVSDLGVFNEENNNCDDCLGLVAEKKKIVDCLDPMNFEIVWASTLFESEIATHLSDPNGGCFIISPDPVDPLEPVTLNTFADFQPQADCDDCLECYGLEYNFETCEELEIFGPTNLITTGISINNRSMAVDSLGIGFLVSNGIIQKIDLSTQTILQSQFIGGTPLDIAIDETNGVIVVVNQSSTFVRFIDYNDLSQFSGITASSKGSGVYFDPISSLFYVTYDSCCSTPAIDVFSGTAYNSMVLVTSFGNVSGYRDIIGDGTYQYVLRSNSTIVEVWSSFAFQTNIFIPDFPNSIDYDGLNTLYVTTNNNCWYITIDISAAPSYSYQTWNYSCNCNTGQKKIKVNNTTDRIYVSDFGCNEIYEFQKSTNTFLRKYNLGTYPIPNFFQPFDIVNDNLGNTWFTSYQQVFQLGSTLAKLTGTTTSAEYLSASTVFFNTSLSACCEITSVSSIPFEEDVLNRDYFSMVSYPNCETCTATTHTVWYCETCDIGGEFLLVDPNGSYSINDVVKIHYGNSNFACAQIIDLYDPNIYGTGYQSFDAQGEPAFATCEECTSGGTVGLTIINCDTLVPQTVNVTIAEYFQIFGLPFGVPQKVISDVNGVCYQIVNLCPIETPAPLFEIANFYINQTFCRLGNRPFTREPISAGTEYFACQVCCPCESGGTVTSVAVPHPTWTGLYGNSVTLLDAIVLGGPNGLNS